MQTHTNKRRYGEENVSNKSSQQLKLEKQLKEDLNAVAATAEGKRVLRHIKDICCFEQSTVKAVPSMGLDIHSGTLFNESRRILYLSLRKYINVQILRQIEHGVLPED